MVLQEEKASNHNDMRGIGLSIHGKKLYRRQMFGIYIGRNL
jgi:hypothetical protein